MNNPPSSSSVPPSPSPSQDQIAQRAREIWLSRGQPAGQDLDIWFAAERELQLPGAATPTPPRPVADLEPGSAVEPGGAGLKKTSRRKKTLQDKLDQSLKPGGYGDGGHVHVGPSA